MTGRIMVETHARALYLHADFVFEASKLVLFNIEAGGDDATI